MHTRTYRTVPWFLACTYRTVPWLRTRTYRTVPSQAT